MRARASLLLLLVAIPSGSGVVSCSRFATTPDLLPRPVQVNPAIVFGERSALLIGAYAEKLEACFVPEDATLAALHRRQDVAEEVSAFYIETDAAGLPVKAKIKHCFADSGTHWSLWSHAAWGSGEWRVWREPGLDVVDPPTVRERKRVL